MDAEQGKAGVVSPAPKPERVAWLDASRGMVICFIAMFHAASLATRYGMPAAAVFNSLYAYRLLGVALFFVISGMNSVRHIEAGWGAAIRERLAPILWMLLLWTAIIWYPGSIITSPLVTPDWHSAPAQIVRGWFLPNSIMWFLWALGGYLILSRLLRPLPRTAVIVGCVLFLIVALGFTEWHMYRYGLGALARNYTLRMSILFFPCFHLGYLFRDQILRFGNSSLFPSLLFTMIVSNALWWLTPHVPIALVQGVLELFRLGLGVMAAIFVARTLMLWRPLRRPLVIVGRMTLPIYLSHILFLPGLTLALAFLGWPRTLPFAPVVAVVAGLLSVPLGVLFAVVVNRLNMLWLFRPPEPFVSGLTGLVTSVTAPARKRSVR